jgi:hypothetical protein
MTRPLRAIGLAGLVTAGWAGWRVEAALATYAAWQAAADPAPAIRLPVALLSFDGVVSRSTAATGRALTDAKPRRPGAAAPAPLATAAQEAPGQTAPTDAAKDTVDTAALATPAPAMDAAHALATSAYAALVAGDRRQADRAFAAALAAAPAHANAALWQQERRGLRQHWHAEAYTLLRSGGAATPAAGQPLLGGGQSGANFRYEPDPLARRPLDIVGRINIGQNGVDYRAASAQAAIGVGWYPFGHTGPGLVGERLVALGTDARNAWSLRLAGGAAQRINAGVPIDLSVYGEAGVVGFRRGDFFAGGQAEAQVPLAGNGRWRFSGGAGAWASAERSGAAPAERLELGPAMRLVRAGDHATLELRADYRLRVAGRARPGSGPAVTLVARH